MVVFRKRRFFLIFSCLMVSFCSFFASHQGNVVNVSNRSYEITQVSSLPVSERVVVLDAGHGGEDRAVLFGVSGIVEADINLQIALKVQALLEQANATVILTRSDENAIYEIDAKSLREKKVSDIKNRVKLGNSSQADIFVSIHLNKIPQSQYYGWQSFYNKNSEKR